MKLNTINNEYQLRSQNMHHQESGKYNNNFLKNKLTYPQDKVDISNVAQQIIQSVDSKQIKLTYSIPFKKISAEVINEDGSRIEVKNENLPKELQGINSSDVFNRFFKNTYAKVSTLSDGNYKLNINRKLLGGGYESGSITPTTQGKATFDFSSFSSYINQRDNRIIDSKEIFKKIQTLEQTETFDNVSLTNDTILDCRRTLKELQHITDDNFIFELEYQEPVAQQIMMQQNDHPLVKRFGINPEAVKGATGYGIAVDKLHYVEQKALEAAFEELSYKTSTETFKKQMQSNQYLNNVVLVDIFARDPGKIKTDPKIVDCSETHTVILWKKKDTEILLIDPSKTFTK